MISNSEYTRESMHRSHTRERERRSFIVIKFEISRLHEHYIKIYSNNKMVTVNYASHIYKEIAMTMYHIFRNTNKHREFIIYRYLGKLCLLEFYIHLRYIQPYISNAYILQKLRFSYIPRIPHFKNLSNYRFLYPFYNRE